jgi:TonB family protein
MQVLWAGIASVVAEESCNQGNGNCHANRTPKIKLRQRVEFSYPEEALHQGIRGTVIVKIRIDKAGLPQAIRIEKGNPILAAAVYETVQRWRWRPYRINCQPVEIEMMMAVNFDRNVVQSVPRDATSSNPIA